MTETILTILALAGSPAGSPAPTVCVAAVAASADEIAATNDLPSLDEVAALPDMETAERFHAIACSAEFTLAQRKKMGANNVDAALAEAHYRADVWTTLMLATSPPVNYGNYGEGCGDTISAALLRRQYLATLRGQLGDTAYYAGAWPSPNPFVPRFRGDR